MFVNHLKNIAKVPMQMDGAKDVVKQMAVGNAEGWADHAMRIFTMEAGGHTPKHVHSWPHINYIISGKGELEIDGKVNQIETGSVAFVPENVEHQFRNASDEPLSFICIVPNSGEY